MPSGINVLTILTFIGCVFELYSSVKNLLYGKEAVAKLEDAQVKLQDAPAFARKMAGPEMLDIAKKSVENAVPIFIISFVSIALCLYGAIEMRKLKKQGYVLWLAGELLPYIGTLIFIGTAFFSTYLAFILVFPIVFIILYTVNKKSLIK